MPEPLTAGRDLPDAPMPVHISLRQANPECMSDTLAQEGTWTPAVPEILGPA